MTNGSDYLNERINIRGELEAIKAILNEREKMVNTALQTAKEAVTKAETAQEKRLDLLNEFRAQSKDEQATYARQDVLERVEEIQKLHSTQFARLYGAMAVVAFIGFTNLLRVTDIL